MPTLNFFEFIQIRNESPDLGPVPKPSDLLHASSHDLANLAERLRPLMPAFQRYLLIGGLPETARAQDLTLSQRILREDVVERVLKRDMTAVFGIRRVAELEKLFIYLCLHSGDIFSPKTCADALEAVGCDRVVTMDLHSPQIQGFFRIPVDNLLGLHALGDKVKQDGAENLVVVAADTGFADEARKFARYLDTPVAISVKQRPNHDEKAEVIDIIGDVRGKTALIVDDFVISGGTLIEDARNLKSKGASRVMAAVTHGVFSPGAMKSLADSDLEALYVIDSVENRPEPLIDIIREVPVAACFGEAIRRISRRESISAMFPE